jgi:two-component system, LuxR family, sensor kinase FixL
MSRSSLTTNRAVILIAIALLIAMIAIADWLVEAETPLGLLYLLPIALAGTIISRRQIAFLAAICTLLAEQFDGFLWNPLVGIPRDTLYFFAFCGVGLFVREVTDSRRRTAIHTADLENEVQARKDAEEQLNVLIESSPIAILTTDAAGSVLLANSAAHRLLGVKHNALPNQSIKTYLPALAKVPHLRNGQQSFRTVMQCRGARSDGEVFMAEVWFSTYLTSAGPRLNAMVMDSSQDMRDREEANFSHLLAGSRILAGAVSHEVRNVCGAIALVHENLARQNILKDNQDFEALGTLVLALEKISNMDLQQSPQQATSVDLQSFFEELRVIIGPALHEQDIQDQWNIHADLPPVWADRQSLTQVFLNLTRNSEVATRDQPVRKLCISTSLVDHRILVSVSDTGGGVQNPELLFKPFQPQARHTGLGLFLSRALMRSFRGDLHYQPSDKGATFIVELEPILDALDESYATTKQQANNQTHSHR